MSELWQVKSGSQLPENRKLSGNWGVSSLPRVKRNRNYLGTFFYLAEGNGQPKTVELLGCKKSTIADYAKELVGEGYLKKVPGSRSPQLYARGPKANVLDAAISELDFHFHGGTVKPPQLPDGVNDPKTVYIPTSRTHINGRVMFSVEFQGDMNVLRIPIGEGKTVDLPLFPKKPVQLQNGVREYRTKVPWNGNQVSVHYIESNKGASSLHVWPYQKELLPEEITPDVEKVFIEEAQRIANHIAKYGGWRFGLVNFKGEIHHASDDPVILSQIPEDMKSVPGSPFWVDNSHGHREIETKDPEAAQMLFNFKNTVKDLRTGQETSINRIYVLELKADKMLQLLEKWAAIMEKDAEIKTAIIENELANTAEKVVKAKAQQSTEAQSYDGVMFA